MKFQRCLMFTGVFILGAFLQGCGDDEDSLSLESSQLIQDVRLTNYELQNSKWDLEVNYFEGSEGRFSKSDNFKNGRSKDKIQRVLDGGRFFIVTNEVKADRVVISPEGGVQDSQSTSQELTGCRLEGSSEMKGSATHLRLNIEWTLRAKLNGDGCANLQDLKNQFGAFLNAEVARLNLKAGKDLFASLEQPLEQAQSFTLRLRLKGEINPKAL